MLVGHFAVGFAAKTVEAKISLGTLTLGAMLADLLWCVFMLAGLEHAAIKPGERGAANYFVMADVPLSHSLLMNVVWGLVAAGLFFVWRKRARGAMLLFGAVLSHWVLDFISHRPDMPIGPGLPGRYGLGLWGSVPATLVVEGGAWLIAVALYLRSTRSNSRIGLVGLWTGIALLSFIWYDNVAGLPHAPRPDPLATFFVFSLFIAWTYWMNRARIGRTWT